MSSSPINFSNPIPASNTMESFESLKRLIIPLVIASATAVPETPPATPITGTAPENSEGHTYAPQLTPPRSPRVSCSSLSTVGNVTSSDISDGDAVLIQAADEEFKLFKKMVRANPDITTPAAEEEKEALGLPVSPESNPEEEEDEILPNSHKAEALRFSIHHANTHPPREVRGLIQTSNDSLGAGAFSNVYTGTLITSDGTTDTVKVCRKVVAIKSALNETPACRRALEHEARIFTFLSKLKSKRAAWGVPVAVSTLLSNAVVGFHGLMYNATKPALILDLLTDGSLQDLVLRKVRDAKNTQNIYTRKPPVIGMGQWLFLAECLCAAFSALKQVGVVHGDIKWNNILLRRHTPPPSSIWSAYESLSRELLYEPVIIDFSSGRLVDDDATPEAISAVTTTFCAPELLRALGSSSASSGPPIATFASDSYSLAFTLLCSAIGADVFERYGKYASIYARDGKVMGCARSCDILASRVPPRGVVAKVLEGCFGRSAEGRTEVEEVGKRIEATLEDWVVVGLRPEWF
ncbi:hypothetical protein RUND412_009908 [Rhizina undulata]